MTRKESIAKTRERRQFQVCRVYEIKADRSTMSKSTRKHLSLLFLEAKWFHNHVLTQENIAIADTKVKSVPVKVGDQFEIRSLDHLSSQMKQAIKDRIFQNILGLSQLKKNGHKAGRLKFKSRIRSIPLKQHNNTFTILRNQNRIRLQGLKQKLRVRGLKQIPDDYEIANANLVKRDSDYFFLVTTYAKKEPNLVPNRSVGIDFGCETQLTLSNGLKLKFQVPVSKRIKRLSRKIQKRKRSKSHNRFKDEVKRRKAHERLNSKRKDLRNKIVHHITSNFRVICFQDENISGWQSGGHGKKIQFSAIGGILAFLKTKAATPVMVDRFFPSTQLCPKCGVKTKTPVEQREFRCGGCGFTRDRDLKAAEIIEFEGLRQLPKKKRPKETSFEQSLLKTKSLPAGRREEERDFVSFQKPGNMGTSVCRCLSDINVSSIVSSKPLWLSQEAAGL